ncbi:MAG: agmatine/peptidylarginine deiminase [Rhodospirillaceae bacterium]
MTTSIPGALGATATPGDDGFYFPPDDARHAQMWMAWPRGETLQKSVAALVQTITRYEPVSLVVRPGEEAAARASCGAVTIVALEHSSPRLRDIGPNFLIDGKGGSAAADWGFSGWGRRRDAGEDARFAHALLGFNEVRRFRTPLTLESSAFVADGEGTLLALAECVFDAKRNPGVSRLAAFGILQKWLGTERVIWLDVALPADELCTDVRALAAFLAPGIVALSTAPEGHPHAEALTSARATLARSRDARGRALTLVDLRVPKIAKGEKTLLLSYTHFLPVNGAVLVPVFDAESDENALDVFTRAFPDRAVEPVPARTYAEHGLSLTSLVLPQPARLLQRDRATTLPRSAWANPIPDVDALLQKYIDMAKE